MNEKQKSQATTILYLKLWSQLFLSYRLLVFFIIGHFLLILLGSSLQLVLTKYGMHQDNLL